MDIFRIFDALNDVDQMRPAIDAVRETGTAVAEVALCYTGDLSDPAETALHPRLLPAAGRADRRGRRARPGDQGHGRAAAPAARPHAGDGAARALRPAGAPAHPRHRGRPARHPAGRDRRRGGRRGRGRRRRWPAPPASRRCRRWWRRPTTPSGPPGWTCRRSATWSPTGRPCARSTRRSSRGCRRPTGRVYHHEIPGGQLSNLRQQAIALGLGDRFELIEDYVRGGRPDARPPGQGHPRRRRWSATWRCTWWARGSSRRTSRPTPANFDVPDSVIGFLRGELGDPPGGWPEPFRTRALEGRPAEGRRRS